VPGAYLPGTPWTCSPDRVRRARAHLHDYPRPSHKTPNENLQRLPERAASGMILGHQPGADQSDYDGLRYEVARSRLARIAVRLSLHAARGESGDQMALDGDKQGNHGDDGDQCRDEQGLVVDLGQPDELLDPDGQRLPVAQRIVEEG
jgi:hypothetical protein